MSTLVVLDHSFHEKTKSTEFFSTAWKQAGWTVINLFDDGWQSDSSLGADEIQKHAPDLLVSFQVLKPASFYRKTGCKNIVLIPMYDSAGGMKPWDWWPYRSFTFLHFSKRLHDRLALLGAPGIWLQFFPNPADWHPQPWDQRKGDLFFWQRRSDISPEAVLDFFSRSWPEKTWKLHWHQASDPGETTEVPSRTGVSMSKTTWFPNRAAYADVLKDYKAYIAPRLTEGIGMSFLEAMALGCVVIANAEATMDEYIVHRQNGLLVDWKNPSTAGISAAEWRAMGLRARASVEEGYARYSRDLAHLIENWKSLTSQRPRWTWGATTAALAYFVRKGIVRPLKKLLGKGH